MKDIVFAVSGAHKIQSQDISLFRERYVEYTIALHKIFAYSYPTYGVLSEYDPHFLPEYMPPFQKFSFQSLIHLSVEALSFCKGKSQREFMSLKALVQEMSKDPTIHDNTFVVKVSGRYVIVKDTLIRIVENFKSDENIQAVICLAKGDYPIQQYTFFFALRWKWFKKFYERSLEDLGGKNVERFIIEFIERENLQGKLIHLDELGILANINNENTFRIF